MKIRTALTLKIAVTTASVFVCFILAVYVLSERSRSKSFFQNLRGETITKAHLFLKNRIDPETMQSIYLNNKEFINEVEVAVYTSDFEMLYHDAVDNDIVKEDAPMINKIVKEGEIDFYVNGYQAVGMLYRFDGRDYVITGAAYDGYGYETIANLGKYLVVLVIIGLFIIVLVAYWLAWASLHPLRDMVAGLNEVSAKRLDSRLPVVTPEDELGEVATVVNELLDRLEKSFCAQKEFVSNVSHELRTPLTALMAELDLALQKERTQSEYQRAISNSLGDAHKIRKLIDGLLNLAKADYLREGINMEELRVDELMIDVQSQLQRAHADYKSEMLFETEQEESLSMMVYGNRYLLGIAFSNLIENNCKYSDDHKSIIQFSSGTASLTIRFTDNGCGMTAVERTNAFLPFYRGENGRTAEGYGIGLALAQKIITLHGGHIRILSERGRGTTFLVTLPTEEINPVAG